MKESAKVALHDKWKKAGVAAGLLAPPLLMLLSLTHLSDIALDGDSALLELGVRLTARGENLLGPYSRFHFHHPGPALFQALSPLYFALAQRHGSFFLTAILLNAMAVWLIYRIVRPRRWTAVLSVGILTSLLLFSRMDSLFTVWNPSLPLLPFAAAVFSFAAAAAGRRPYLLPALVLATLAVQSHLAYTVPAISVGLAAGLAILFPRLVGGGAKPSMNWRLAAGVAVAPALLWFPPLYEELSRGDGNISQLIAFFSLPHQGVGALSTMGILGHRLAGFLFGSLDPSPVAPWLSGALVLALPVAYYRSSRRGDSLAASLSLVAMAGLAGSALAVSRIVGPLHDYLVAWVSTFGLAGFSALVLAVGHEPESKSRHKRAAKLMAAVLSLLLLSSTLLNLRAAKLPKLVLGTPDTPRHLELAEFFEALNRALGRSGADLPEVRIATGDCWPTAAITLLHLDKEGVRFCVEDAWVFQYGSALACPRAIGRPHRLAPLLVFGDRGFQDQVKSDPRFDPIARWEGCAAFLSLDPPPPEVVDFSGPDSTLFLTSGFTPREEVESDRGRWSIGTQSTITVPLRPHNGYDLEIRARPLVIPGRTQTIRAVLNGSPVAFFPLVAEERSYWIRLPAGEVGEVNTLQLDYAYAEPPMLHSKLSQDWRPLGVFFRHFRFVPVPKASS